MRMTRRDRPSASTMAILAGRLWSASVGGGSKADIKIGSDNFYESKLDGRDVRPGPRAAGYKVTRNLGLGPRQERAPAFERARSTWCPSTSARASASTTRPRSPATARRTAAALQAHLRRPRGNLATVLGDHARRGHQRRRRPQGHRRPAQADQDERPGRRPGPAQVGPAARLRHEPAVQGRARGVRHHLPAEAARGARRLRRPDRRGPQGQGHRLRLAVLDPAGHRRSSASSLLEDDKKTQPAENIAPVVRNDYLAKVDATAFAALLDAVVGQDDDRGADQARRQGRASTTRTSRDVAKAVADRPGSAQQRRPPTPRDRRRPARRRAGFSRSPPDPAPGLTPCHAGCRMTTARDRPPEEAAEDTSFARGLRVLLTIADRGEIRADELATLLETPLSTDLPLPADARPSSGSSTAAMAATGSGRGCSIGGGTTVSSEELIRRADPILAMLGGGDAARPRCISRRVGLAAVCLHQQPSRHALRVVPETGSSAPLGVGAMGAGPAGLRATGHPGRGPERRSVERVRRLGRVAGP